MPLEYRQLGSSDLRVSSIGLGCVTFGREIDAATSFDVLDRAVERGINLLDTAAVYGSGASEKVIGRWLGQRKARENVVLATKVSGTLTHEDIFQSVEESLERLGTDRIDLLQSHTWDAQTPLAETLGAFEKLIRQGKVRYCGCSNWDCSQLCSALNLAGEHGWQRLESVQPIYNLVDRRIECELLPLCVRHDVGIVTYSPLGAGFLVGKYRQGETAPQGTRFDVIPGHQDVYFTDHGFRVVEGLRSIASRTGHTMVQLALSWVFQRRGITSVLIGARHPDQVDQAFDALEARFPDSLYEHLDELSRLADGPEN
jgi:aryl-alcohol dehydrogenase-like predicted oxidoreductase